MDENQQTVEVRDLLARMVPPFVFETTQHAALCVEAADEVVGNRSALAKVLTNLYKRYAVDLQTITACEYLAAQGLPSPTISTSPPLSQLAIDRLRDAGVIFRPEPTRRLNWRRLAQVRYVGRVVAKVLAHWLFILAGLALAARKSRVQPSRSVIRAWVDVTEELYPEEFFDALVIVYPFDISFRRQWRFLASLRARKIRYTLAGYPYSPMLLFRWIVTRDDRYRASLELEAAVKHGEYVLRRFRPTCVLTTDEFEAASFAMHERLIAADVKVENKAHGVGKYSPFVSYSRFQVLNDSQADYYTRFNPGLHTTIAPREVREWPLHKVRVLVLVDQLVKQDGSFLDAFQNRVLQVLKRIGPALGYDVALKLHPNSKQASTISGVVCERGLPWSPGEALFLTAFSTAYLSFERLGPTWLLEDAFINPRLVFGKEARVASVDHLEEFIRGLRDSEKSSEKSVHGILHDALGG